MADSAALALVEEYLGRDARGEFLGASEWLLEFAGGAMINFDGMSIMSDYEILAAETRCDTTRITVQYDVIGGCCTYGPDNEAIYTLTDSVELRTFVVVSTEEGARLSQVTHPHVSGTAMLERGFRDEKYRRALEEVLRRKGGALPPDSTREAAAAAQSDARLLVEEYLRRDARGEFKGQSEWLAEVTYHALIDFSGYSIISDYEILAAETRGDTTRVTVQYDVLGGWWAGSWSLTDSVAVWTFIVVETEEGPRLTGELIDPHVSARDVLERNLADEEYRHALEEALRRKGG